MSYELTGTLKEIFPTEQKSDRFSKREFVVETSESNGDRTFTDYIKFQTINDKCAMLDSFNTGDTVKVSFNIKGNRWEKNDGSVSYFTNLDAWRVESVAQGGESAPVYESSPTHTESDAPPFEDDLPF